jgi:chemotaxis protein methyltransferase CheR
MAITNQAFQFAQKMIADRTGLALAERDKYLVEARLLPLARLQRMNSVEELIEMVRSGSSNGLPEQLLDALLPKETCFFRDNHPFELLRNRIFRALEGARYRECRITIWCAGCAGGQEAFSVAMFLHRYFSQLLSWKIEILGTDISQEALAKARQGKYDEVEVHRGVQPLLIREYFRQSGPHYTVKEDIARLVRFEELNLVGEWPEMPPVDLVLMRNVLRYMTLDSKKRILEKLKQVLRPEGFLLLGAQESTVDIDDSYEMVPTEKTVYYQLSRGHGQS